MTETKHKILLEIKKNHLFVFFSLFFTKTCLSTCVFFLELVWAQQLYRIHPQLSPPLRCCAVCLVIISFRPWAKSMQPDWRPLTMVSRNWFNMSRSGLSHNDCGSNFIFSCLWDSYDVCGRGSSEFSQSFPLKETDYRFLQMTWTNHINATYQLEKKELPQFKTMN